MCIQLNLARIWWKIILKYDSSLVCKGLAIFINKADGNSVQKPNLKKNLNTQSSKDYLRQIQSEVEDICNGINEDSSFAICAAWD